MTEADHRNASTLRTGTASMAVGATRFAVVSVAAFSVWAFGGGMPPLLLYTAITLVFLGLAGFLLFPLLDGERRVARFSVMFIPGFLLYAILWCIGWFGIGGHAGEILGSAAGLAALSFVVVRRLGAHVAAFLPALGVLFLFHTLGYTLGGICYGSTGGNGLLAPILEGQRTLGRLLWGVFYGLGFGAGLGFLVHEAQRRG